jgi:2-polyprenyl-6-methoxyphenol hydroxylase-like FAD-dependent oxidoreductase
VRIVIIGASAAGIFSALVLGRSGHDVLLIEQDRFAIAEDAEAAARTAFRTGAPQRATTRHLAEVSRTPA